MNLASIQDRLNELFDSDSRNDTAIAALLGVSKQAISAWRSGTRSPKKSVLIKISELYNVSIEWLMGFDVDKDGISARMNELPESDTLRKIIVNMKPADYQTVWELIDKTYKKMKEEGKI